MILDMHQDQYSRLHPAGQAVEDAIRVHIVWRRRRRAGLGGVHRRQTGLRALRRERPQPGGIRCVLQLLAQPHGRRPAGERRPAPALQDHYIGALVALARTFEHNSDRARLRGDERAAAGLVVVATAREPLPGDGQDLFPFYQRVIEALTGVRDGLATCPASAAELDRPTPARIPQLADVTRQQIFVEPMAYRNLVDFSPQVSKPFTDTQPGLGAAPLHPCVHPRPVHRVHRGRQPVSRRATPSATRPRSPRLRPCTLRYSQPSSGTPSSTDGDVLAGETAAQESTLTGGTVWAWKGLLCDARAPAGASAGSTARTRRRPTGHLARATLAVHPPPRTGSSPPVSSTWPGFIRGRPPAPCSLTATTRASAPSTWLRWGPAESGGVIGPQKPWSTSLRAVKGSVAVSGAAELDTVVVNPDGSRIAYVAPTRSSGYGLTVGGPANALVESVNAEAAAPLPPIGEVQARQAAEATIAQAKASSDPTIASNAALAGTLASLLLGTSDPVAG